MSWKQLMAVLTLVVAMFSTVVIVSTSYNVSGFERVEGKIEQLESVLGGRIEQLEHRMGQFEHRMGQLENKMGQLEHRMGQFEHRMGQLEHRVHRLDDKIDGLSNEVAEIKGALKAKKIMADR